MIKHSFAPYYSRVLEEDVALSVSCLSFHWNHLYLKIVIYKFCYCKIFPTHDGSIRDDNSGGMFCAVSRSTKSVVELLAIGDTSSLGIVVHLTRVDWSTALVGQFSEIPGHCRLVQIPYQVRYPSICLLDHQLLC